MNKPDKRRKYDDTLKAEALRLAHGSRRHECLANAQAESLWARLETEELGPRE